MKTRMIVLLFLFSGYFNSNATSISGKNISFLEEGDSIIIFLDKIGSTSIDPDLNDIYSAIYKKNEFSVSINIGMRPQYLDVAYYRNGQKFGTKLIGLLLEKGDSILMHSGSDKLMFSGKGSITWIIQMQIFDIRDYYSHKMDYNESKIKFTESISDSLYDSTFRCLSKNKNSLSMPVYSLLKADIIGIVNLRYNYIINISVSVKNVRGLIDSILSYRTLLSKRMISLAVDELPFARFSKYYSAGILSEYTFDSCVVPNKSLDIDRYILFVDKYFLGRINEKLKTNALYKVRRMGEFRGITSRYLPIYLKQFRDPTYKEILSKLELQTQGGSKAYNFTLIDKDGKGHVLEEYRGNVLLLDFWFLGCGNCQRVYPYIDSIATLLKEKKIKFLVLSINIDGRISAWEKGIASGKYTSENEVNLNTAGKEGANCLERYNITGCPTLILIDKNGKIMKQPIDPRADKGKDLISQILHG